MSYFPTFHFFIPSLHLPVHTSTRWWQMDWKGDNFTFTAGCYGSPPFRTSGSGWEEHHGGTSGDQNSTAGWTHLSQPAMSQTCKHKSHSGASSEHNRQTSNEPTSTCACLNVAALLPRTEEITGNVGKSKFPEIWCMFNLKAWRRVGESAPLTT